MAERTFVMLKPEAVTRRLSGEIIKRIEKEGFRIVAVKLTKATLEQAERLYEVHVNKSFYKELVNNITSGPILPMVVEGKDAVRRMRALIGATNPAQAEVGTIRRDFGLSITKNVIHAADNPENSQKEIEIFFSEDEIMDY